MKKMIATSVLAMVLPFSVGAKTVSFEGDLCERERSWLSNSPDEEALESFAKNYHFVLIKGYLNSLYGGKDLSTYFLTTENRLQNLTRRNQVSNLNVKSKMSIRMNAKKLCKKIETISKKKHVKDKKLVLVGHSMGGGVLMALPLYCKELIQERVAALVPVNAVINGTPAADALFVEKDKKKLEDYKKNLSKKEYREATISESLLSLAASKTEEGVKSLSVTQSNQRLKEIRQKGVADLLRRKTFFVTSSEDSDKSNMFFAVRATGKFLDRVHRLQNDGLVPKRNQSNDELGRILLHVEGADHLDLVVGVPFVNKTCRDGFVDELLRELKAAGLH